VEVYCANPKCGAPLPQYEENCLVCGRSGGAPNVRNAGLKEERDALQARVGKARKLALARRCASELANFEAYVGMSQAVIVRPLAVLDSFVHSDNQLLLTFHQAVRAKGRLPDKNEWDPRRETVDSAINPYIFDRIHFAALSGDGKGVSSFGGYHVTLKESAVELRTTVFEENGFPFLDRHHNRVPPGYRAAWPERGLLAVAKLHSKLSAGISTSVFPDILLDQGTTHGDSDFIEVHIYGLLHRRAIERVEGAKPVRKEDKFIWRKIRRSLEGIGVEVMET
jgi:hypothetical protein